jgi:hypothetical protein
LTSVSTTPTAGHQKFSTDDTQQQMQRILRSNTLRNSPTLQNLLQFLVSRTTDGNLDGVKEYTIGVEAFGRRPDFDPKTDTIVRVQTHRLRQKLREYYQQEGLTDQILIEVPKGHYCPVFRLRTDPPGSLSEVDPSVELETAPDPPQPLTSVIAPATIFEKPAPADGKRSLGWFLSIAILVFFGAMLGFFVGRSHPRAEETDAVSTATPKPLPSSDPVKAFWASFLNNDPSPIIAYPNAVFLLDDSNDLFRFREGASDNRGARVDAHLAHQYASNPTLAASAGQLYYENGYTGTGELEGVAMLTALFAEMGLKPVIKTSRNITPEDLQQHAVILLGSPFQNIAVAQLQAVGDFSFQNPDAHREEWRAQILNAHPGAGENSSYHTERDPDTEVLKMDYSLISIQPGVVEGHNIAVIGGLDTKGTEGATRFMTSRAGIETLSTAMATKKLPSPGMGSIEKHPLIPFQALVQVHLEKGDQVLSTELVSVHPFPPKK